MHQTKILHGMKEQYFKHLQHPLSTKQALVKHIKPNKHSLSTF